MPALGSGINAGLGRIDYSPIARGGEAAARGIIGAANAKAQGMMSLGQSIGQGIESFQKRQKENAILTGQIGAMAQQAGVGEFLDEKNKKLLEEFIDPEKELNNKKLSQLMASLSVASAENQKKQEYAQKAREFQLQAAEVGAQMNNLAARTGLANAQTAAAGIPKPPSLTDAERTVQARLKAIADSGQPITPEIEADIRDQVRARGSMAGDPEQKARLELIKTRLPVFSQRADSARDLLPGVANIAQKLNTGLETGKMAPVITFVSGWADALGIPVDTEALADKEAGAAIFNQFMLEFLQKTKGSISERENALFQSMGPQFSKSTKANKELVALVSARLRNDIELGRIYEKGIASDKPLGEILSEISSKADAYEQKFLSELEDLAQAVIPIPPPRRPEGVTQREWDAMTDEQKALFR